MSAGHRVATYRIRRTRRLTTTLLASSFSTPIGDWCDAPDRKADAERFRHRIRGDLARRDQTKRVTTDAMYDGAFTTDHPYARGTGTRIEYDPRDRSNAGIVGGSNDRVDRVITGSVFAALLVTGAVVVWRRPAFAAC